MTNALFFLVLVLTVLNLLILGYIILLEVPRELLGFCKMTCGQK